MSRETCANPACRGPLGGPELAAARCTCGLWLTTRFKPYKDTDGFNCKCTKRIEANLLKQLQLSATEGPGGARVTKRPAGKLSQKESEYEILSKHGLKLAEGGRFKQVERMEALPAETTAQVAKGICAGQCLHWIRRVLQGGRLVYSQRPDKGLKVSSAVAQMQITIEAGASISDWPAFAATADQYVRDVRRKNNLPRLFVGIRITNRDIQKQTHASVGDFIDELFKKSEFTGKFLKAPVAAMLGVDVRGVGEDGTTPIGGHAIAVLRDVKGNRYRVFDPNYGVFAAKDDAALRGGIECLMTAVWQGYGVAPWKVLDQFSVTVFEAVEAPAEAAAPPAAAAAAPVFLRAAPPPAAAPARQWPPTAAAAARPALPAAAPARPPTAMGAADRPAMPNAAPAKPPPPKAAPAKPPGFVEHRPSPAVEALEAAAKGQLSINTTPAPPSMEGPARKPQRDDPPKAQTFKANLHAFQAGAPKPAATR